MRTDISPPTICDSTDDIQITNVLPPSVNDIPPMKRRKLILSNEEKQTILNGDMLTDESVNIAQNILSDQFPGFGGFQDTVIGKTQAFDVVKSAEPYTVNSLITGHSKRRTPPFSGQIPLHRQNHGQNLTQNFLNSGRTL